MPFHPPKAIVVSGAILLMTCSPTWAETPLDQSCLMLAVLGQNDAGAVAPALQEVASHWPEDKQVEAISQVTQIIRQITFAGGNVYEIGRLGEDLVDHLVVLRLAPGETAGLRLTYEWSPDGLALSRMDFKLDYTTDPGLTLPIRSEPEACQD